MAQTSAPCLTADPALQAYLLGMVDFDEMLRCQRRLVYEVSGDRSRSLLFLCEHPPLISVGREGSREHPPRPGAVPARPVCRAGRAGDDFDRPRAPGGRPRRYHPPAVRRGVRAALLLSADIPLSPPSGADPPGTDRCSRYPFWLTR